MTDLGLATKIFFGIAGACVVLIIIVFLAKRIKLPSKDRIHPYVPEPPIKVPSAPQVIEKRQPPPEYDPEYIASLQGRIEYLERRLLQAENRIPTSWLTSDNSFKVMLSLIGYMISIPITVGFLAFILALIFSLASSVLSIFKNIPLGH